MGGIIVALPKLEDAKHISEILKRRGIEIAYVCNTGANILSYASQLDGGIVICASQFKDMHCTQLARYLPEQCEMLLLVSKTALDECPTGIVTLTYPIKSADLVGTVEMMLQWQERKRRKKQSIPKKRTEKEQNYINNAKWVLMERNNMTEQEAFRYIQKCSMDSGTNMVETAQMILLMICEE